MQSPIPYNSIYIKISPLIISLTFVFSLFYQPFPGIPTSNWLPKLIFLEIFIFMKLAAPRIPFLQLALVVITLFAITSLIDYLILEVNLLYYFLGNIILPIICVFGFGQYWVSKSYIPSSKNKW